MISTDSARGASRKRTRMGKNNQHQKLRNNHSLMALEIIFLLCEVLSNCLFSLKSRPPRALRLCLVRLIRPLN
jgi:hypothetical protein